jgi:hypothetical protein
MSGLLFLLVLCVHATFALNGFRQLLAEIQVDSTVKHICQIGIATILIFNASLVCWFFLVKSLHSSTQIYDSDLFVSVGLGVPFLSFVTAYYLIPKGLQKISDFAYRTSKAGIGLALFASSVFFMMYSHEFVTEFRIGFSG